MILGRQTTWREEGALWAFCLAVVLLLSVPLIISSVQDAGLGYPSFASKLAAKSATLTSHKGAAIEPQAIMGQSNLDLDLLSRTYSPGEADNIRWSLVRRTPAAATVYHPDNEVDWPALRRLSEMGTILLPAGFSWSFNETFQQGPGYKVAGGILAGGHCSLATVFRTAAMQAGLQAVSRPHARPIPGFSLEETVNIYWGRDDLIVHNTSNQDLYFVWTLTPERVELDVLPVSAYRPLPLLPDWPGATTSMVYGRPGPGGWGSLGKTTIADQALHLARTYAGRVDGWNGTKMVVAAVNPNVAMAGRISERDLYLYYLIAEARRQGIYVMLDVQTADREPLPLFTGLMDKFIQENVWFDWDIEHTEGGAVTAEQINQVAGVYFGRRQVRGYQSPGVFGFYVFRVDQVSEPDAVRRHYENGIVVPIFNGYGGHRDDPVRDKIAVTRLVLSRFGEGPYGIMEFESRWGTRYDQISAKEYYETFPQTLILAIQ